LERRIHLSRYAAGESAANAIEELERKSPPRRESMNDSLEIILPSCALSSVSGRLPLDIENHERKLRDAQTNVEKFATIMDKYFFGLVGFDPIIGLVPWVGDVISGLLCIWLLIQASRVNMPASERMTILGLAVVDTLIGFIPVIGDAADFFFKAHLWSAGRVNTHIEGHRALIDQARARAALSTSPLAHDHPDMVALRDVLFRGGKTQQQVWMRSMMIIGLIGSLLAYCSFDDFLKHQRISACEARGGWFCSWRS
jgi:hypothetical protein